MATWSLRLRPVWSLAAAGASSVARRSTAVWMSSSDGRNANDALGQLLLHLVEGGQHLVALGVGEDADAGQPAHVGAGPGDVVGRQALVEGQAHGEGEQLLGRPALEATVPERGAGAGAVGPSRWPWVPAQVSTDRPHRRTKPAESSWRKLSSAS